MYHIFFVHFSVDGHLGCFRVLAIVCSAAVNSGVHASFLIENFLWIDAQEWDCRIIWYFYYQLFKELPYCSLQWLHQFTFPTNSAGGFPFLHLLSCSKWLIFNACEPHRNGTSIKERSLNLSYRGKIVNSISFPQCKLIINMGFFFSLNIRNGKENTAGHLYGICTF